MLRKIENPCEGCDNLGCDLDEPHSMKYCHEYIEYQASIKVQTETAWAIVDWLEELASNCVNMTAMDTLEGTVMALKQSLASEGILRPDVSETKPDHIANKRVDESYREVGVSKFTVSITHREFLCLPLETRRRILREQAADLHCTCDKVNRKTFGVGLAGDCPVHGKE